MLSSPQRRSRRVHVSTPRWRKTGSQTRRSLQAVSSSVTKNETLKMTICSEESFSTRLGTSQTRENIKEAAYVKSHSATCMQTGLIEVMRPISFRTAFWAIFFESLLSSQPSSQRATPEWEDGPSNTSTGQDWGLKVLICWFRRPAVRV